MGIYKNVMELLVEEEVVRQFKALSERIAAYVNQVEWVAYALNQLPPLYATSEKGLKHQLQIGRTKHSKEIQQAVQRALAAVRRDPIRSSTPLQHPGEPAREALFQLRFLLRNDRLEWESVPHAVEVALERANRDAVWTATKPLRNPIVYSPVRGASPFPNYPPLEQSLDLPDRTSSTARQSGQASHPPTAQPDQDLFGWDDPLYNSR